MKTSYRCSMSQGGILWKMSILNMSFYKEDKISKTKACNVVCVGVRDALVLASACHSEWVQPSTSLPPSASRHISGTSLKSRELFLFQGRFPAGCHLPAWREGGLPLLHDSGRRGGNLCLNLSVCLLLVSTRMRRGAEKSYDLSYSNTQ